MKVKKIFTAIMIYLYALTMVIGMTPVKAMADADYVIENINTLVANKYNISPYEDMYYAKQYNDSRIVVTTGGVYNIKNGTSQKFALDFNMFGAPEYSGRNGDQVYLTYRGNLITLNLSTGTNTITALNNILSDGKTHDVSGAAAIDTAGNKWFSVTEFDNVSKYNLLKIDTKGNAVEYKIQLPTIILNMAFDNNNNLRFFANGSFLGTFNTSTGLANEISYNGFITESAIAKNGDIWVIEAGNKSVKHLNASNTVIESFSGTDPRAIDVDDNGNVWLFDSGVVKKLQNGSFVNKFNVPFNRDTISAVNGNLILSGATGITTIDAVPVSGDTPVNTPIPAPEPVSAPSYPNQLVLDGSNGQSVTTVQDKLKSLGFDTGQIDGKFGPITRNAVISFQGSKGLVPDGIVGPLTWGRLFGFNVGVYSGNVSQGTGTTVIIGGIQDKLISLGFDPGIIDGIFGSRTMGAIESFQSANNLIVDGIVGPITWRALFD